MSESEMVDEGRTPPPDAPDTIDGIIAAWNVERPDIDVSSVAIISRLWRVGRHLERERSERLAKFGTDRVTLDVLAMLRRAGPDYRRTAGDLTHSSLITSGGVSQRLDRLEKAGLVTRHIHPEDRRRVEVQLTEKGRALIDGLLADIMEHEQNLLQCLTPLDQADLGRTLKVLLASFEPIPETTEQ